MGKTIGISLAIVVTVGVVLSVVLKNVDVVPQVVVSSQTLQGSNVVIEMANAVAPSWLVIQTETNGAPGPVIGYVKINKGENKNVSVKIDTEKKTPRLFAMIHEDDGEIGKLDFPNNDMPLMYKDEMVSKIFSLQ